MELSLSYSVGKKNYAYLGGCWGVLEATKKTHYDDPVRYGWHLAGVSREADLGGLGGHLVAAEIDITPFGVLCESYVLKYYFGKFGVYDEFQESKLKGGVSD